MSFSLSTTISPLNLFLTVLVMLMAGLRRIWHINDLMDTGLSLFTGRHRLLDQSTISKLCSHLQGVEKVKSLWAQDNVCQLQPLSGVAIGLDDHVVPYWGYAPIGATRVATRGRTMKATKFFYAYALNRERIIHFDSTKAKIKLSQHLPRMVRHLRSLFGKKKKLLFLFDKGGYKGSNFELLTQMPETFFITPAKNTGGNVKQWEKLPESRFRDFFDPEQNEPYRVAVTYTTVKGCSTPLRTILLKGEKGFRGFFTDIGRLWSETIVDLYSTHWLQENSYRVLKNDLALDALPNRVKKSGNALVFNQTAIDYIAWVKSYAFNLIKDFGSHLGQGWDRKYASTVLRKFVMKPGKIELYADRIIVKLALFKEARELMAYITAINEQEVTVPWLENRRLTIELEVPGNSRNK